MPYAFLVRYAPYAQPLTKREFETMLLCDGEHDIEFDEVIMELTAKRLIVSCEKGEHPSEWSMHKSYDNRYFPKMNLMITGKCNYNCLHCFNAADNAPLMTEWTFEELCDLFDQAKACGVHALTITGGCRAMGFLYSGERRDFCGEDITKCRFFENGWYEKTSVALAEWKNSIPIQQ